MPVESSNNPVHESIPTEKNFGTDQNITEKFGDDGADMDDQFGDDDDNFENMSESYGGDDAFDSQMEKKSTIKDSIKNSVKEDNDYQESFQDENIAEESGQQNFENMAQS